MQTIAHRIRPFIGSRSFYRSALAVMIPVTIQQLINNLFNMVDNLMVGTLDVNGLAMSAVTVANRPYMIFFGVFFGICGAAGLMISQYYGAEDRKTCQGLFSLQLIIGLVASLLFGMILFLFPERVMRIFVSDPHTVELGVDYLRIVWLSYIPVAISNVCIFSLRSLGQNRISMVVSLAAMGVNASCNYVLIFGKLGFPAMGVAGAAMGTLISRLVEMVFYISLLVRKKTIFRFSFTAFRWLNRSQLRAFWTKALPLMLNEILWTCGMNVYFWSYARLSEASLPAVTIGEQISQIASVMAMGTSSAVSVLIGTELGANRLQKARENCKKLLSLVVVIGLCCVVLCCILGTALPYAYKVTPELRSLATRITITMGAFTPLNFIYGFCFYCMRAGGDTRNAMLLDSGYMWLVPVPVAVLMGVLLPGKIGIGTAVLIIQCLMNAKVALALHTLKKGRWVRNITISQ